MWRKFIGRFKPRDGSESIPPNQPEEQVDPTDAYNSIFDSRMYLTRLAYRVPFFFIEVLVIMLLTLLVPVVAGLLLITAIEAVQPGNTLMVRLLGFWVLGLSTIGGTGITIFVISAIWSALKDAAVRLAELIRERK